MKRLIMNLGLLQVFFSLMLVIAIMFASTYMIYRNSISGIYDKVSENNSLVFQSIVQSFDNSFTTINNIIHSIDSMMPYDNLRVPTDGSSDMASVYTMVENLSTLISTIDYIEEVVVFYNDSNLAITSIGTSDLDLLFRSKYRHETYNANYWRTYSLSKHFFKLFPAEDFLVQTSQQRRHKKLMVAFGGNMMQSSAKNIMVIIDVDALMKQANTQAIVPGASLIVLDQDRNNVLSTEQNLDLMDILNDVYFNPGQEASLTRENYEYNIHKSEYNGFIYIDKVPYQFQNLDSVAKANHMIMLAAIISAIILAIFISIYLNRPVKNILRLLGGGVSKGNDFRKIYSGIVKIQADNESYRNQLNYADAELRRGVFLQALDEYVHDKEHDIQMQKYYPDFFGERHFVMVMIQVHGGPGEKRYPWPIESVTEQIRRGLARDGVKANVFHTANAEFIAVIGLGVPTDREPLKKHLGAYIQRAEKEEFRSFALWSCVSRLYTSEIGNCKRAYRDLTRGIAYRNVNVSDKVMDVEEIHYVWGVHIPYEKLEKLSNCVLGGKTAESIQMLKELLQENVDRNIHRHQLQHIARTIFFHLLRHLGNSQASNDELYRLESEYLVKIERTDHVQWIENELINVIKYVAKLHKQEQPGKLNPSFIAQYIEEHYMEDLFLDDISEVTETTPKYFSNYFKKAFGVNYVEYLNKVRLSHARELLMDTNLSIAEISEKTGYLNASTFTTTFKKYMGISPSDYRKQNAHE